MSRFVVGPACGGNPPFCFVLEAGQPWGVVFGRTVPGAEEKARREVERLNRDFAQPSFRWLDETGPSAEVIPIRPNGSRRR